MGITEKAVKNPAGVAVAVAIITLFGLFSLGKLPVQLFPDIELPQLTLQQALRLLLVLHRQRNGKPCEVRRQHLLPQ